MKLVSMNFYVMSYLNMLGEGKRCFTKIMSLPLNQVGEEEGDFTSDINHCKGGERCDDLLEEGILLQNKASEQVVIKAYLLVT